MRKKAFVFGRGKYWDNYREKICKSFEVVGFLDNAVNESTIDTKEQKMVYPPSSLAQLPQHTVIIASSYFFDMYKQLKQLGISDTRISFFCGHDIKAENNSIYFHFKGDEWISLPSPCELKELIRKKYLDNNDDVKRLKEIGITPISNDGSEYGMPIDRYYIEKFIYENRKYIQGAVMEVQDNRYTSKFGLNNVASSCICHVKGWNGALKINFENGEGIKKESIDCMICTQTLQYIYHVETAVNNIFTMLKKGGSALITVPGIKPISIFHDENWGEYWSFTEKSVKKICENIGQKCDYETKVYGNAKTAAALLYGICAEEFSTHDLDYADSRYPFIIGLRLSKC